MAVEVVVPVEVFCWTPVGNVAAGGWVVGTSAAREVVVWS